MNDINITGGKEQGEKKECLESQWRTPEKINCAIVL